MFMLPKEQIFHSIRIDRWKQGLLVFFVTILPNVDFYYGLLTETINWALVRQYVPTFLFSLMTALLLIEWIKAKADNYEINKTQTELMRLNQLYKERFKMVMRGEAAHLFGDVEKERWRNRLYLKEPNNKKNVDEFIDRQYGFTHFDIDGIPTGITFEE
jgi:hypothetical protein